MDNLLEIQLGQDKNAFSVNTDEYTKLSFSQKISEITEYDIINVLSASEVFELERQNTNVYRIYGKIQFLSILNGLSNSYAVLPDFFLQEPINSKNVVNSFDFYLLKAGTGYTQCTGLTVPTYVRYFDVIATPVDFQIYPVGYSNNVYGEQDYAFNFNSTFNVDLYFDNFGFPATELFLYPVYKVKLNGDGHSESMKSTKYNSTGGTYTVAFTSPILNLGDRVYGDLIDYIQSEFFQSVVTPQTYYISTPYASGVTINYLMWQYNPFISVRLRYFSDTLQSANISGTSYYEVASIPPYATDIGNGNRVWRNILDQGISDPISGIGVNYPFVNQRRYLFQYTILDVIPDLMDANTLNVFSEIDFPPEIPISNVPISNLDNIGKPCQ